MAASVITQGIRVTKRQPIPLMPFYRIGEFSKVLTAMKPDDANIIINGIPTIAGFLAAKCLAIDVAMEKHPEIFGGGVSPETIKHWAQQFPQEAAMMDQMKRDYAKNDMDNPVWKPTTEGELVIFRHLKYNIVRAVKKSASFKKPTGPGAGAPGGAVGAPVAKPGIGTPPRSGAQAVP
jgi:hypothetical protein